MKECDYIVHTASPHPEKVPKDNGENSIIKPAIEGTLSILKAANKHNVKKVVLTSSISSIIYSKKDISRFEFDESVIAQPTDIELPY